MKTTDELTIAAARVKTQDRSVDRTQTAIAYRAKVYRGKKCIADFTGPHAEAQATLLLKMAQNGAKEATDAKCVADVGRAAVHERSLKDHPILLEVLAVAFAVLLSQCSTENTEINGNTPCAAQTCWAGDSRCDCIKNQHEACFCTP